MESIVGNRYLCGRKPDMNCSLWNGEKILMLILRIQLDCHWLCRLMNLISQIQEKGRWNAYWQEAQVQ